MSISTLPSAVTDYFTLLNADTLEGFVALWQLDATLTAFGRDGRRTRTGRDDVLVYYHDLFAPWATHHDEIVRTAVAGAGARTTVTVEILFTGTTHDGGPVAFDALDVFELVDGRIRRLAIWHDVVTTRRLLGA